MKKTLILFLVALFCFNTIKAQGEKKEYTILLTGASFADEENGWFEIGVRHLNAVGINRAIGGEAIADAANRMAKGELYSIEELEKIDAFVIMQVHDRDVASMVGLKEDYTDYSIPFDRSNYAAAYDYVIKKYMTDCYNLKFNEKSKYYNTAYGKPPVIVLATHWHDSRVVYNTSIRLLSERWGFPLIKFDEYIGFSKNAQHPVTKEQLSVMYNKGNQEKINGMSYGWHQHTGQDKYIQQRMAAIFVDLMKKILPLQ